MHVERVEVTISPGFIENCYLLSDAPDSDTVVIVDPGAQPRRILAAVGERSIERIILTHRHYDHTAAVPALLKKARVEVVAHKFDADAIPDLEDWHIPLKKLLLRESPVTRIVEEGELIAVGSGQVRVLHTPGHTVGSMCLHDEENHILIAGDTLFYGAVGRTDLSTGDPTQQRESLKRLATLPDDTVVHPGHDEDTSIGRERKYGFLGLFGQRPVVSVPKREEAPCS
ncbi:MAG: MBL fold metallo-hydrolase [Coriobacteriales bacterium]|jgi:glyoxylase-like metal-dependent hydrolase (beta-lactamase superfamily II)|nr:MBL fold metallo-hydrolase [Coriobacteriales bacterium]